MNTLVGRSAPPVRGKARRILTIAVLTLAVLLVEVTARVFVWPDLAPLPAHADAVIELNGSNSAARLQLADDLVLAHRAPLVILSTIPDDPSCYPPVPIAFECFVPEPLTTRGEARYIGQLAAERHWTSIILVTTPDQAWRAKLRVSRCFSGKIYSATAPLRWYEWVRQIPYQWAASVKALTVERGC
jgi:uncharacterized SAM-binding protein YcdF (DUF218 family)